VIEYREKVNGGIVMNTFISIVIYLFSLFILYIVIESAVRKGINSSIIGQTMKKRIGITEEKKKSFFDNDLDDDR